MQNYPIMQNYSNFHPMMNPYQDRLSQLQNNYQQTVGTPNPVNQGLLWVSGEVGAKSYLVAPNSTVLLMDSDAQRFYLKSADSSGMPSLRIFEYSEVSNAPQNTLQASQSDFKELDSKYVTRDEYEGLKSQYRKIMERFDSIVFDSEPVEQPTKSSKSKGRGGNGNNDESII